MKRFFGRVACFILVALLLNACAVGVDYKKPHVQAKDKWAQQTDAMQIADHTAPPSPPLADEILPSLLQQALANNNDLKVAEARIAEAHANERAAIAALLPQINASGNYGRQTVNQTFVNRPDTTSQIGLQGNWDLDVFGGLRRRDEAAAATTAATVAAQDDTRLKLLAEVANNYMQLRSAQQQRAITVKNETLQQATLAGIEAQRAEGAISDFEVARAAAQLGATQARLPQIDRTIVAAINRLNILMGVQPGTLDIVLNDVKPLPAVPPAIIIATPVNVIEQRPDIRAAERQLAAASALSNAAFADFFPKISLESFFGAQHSNLFGSQSPWSAAVNGLFPLLDFGRIRSQVNAANAREQQAFYTYQQTVLAALEDVENALAAYTTEQRRHTILQGVTRQQAKAADIVREQYKAGVATELDLLTTQQNQLDADNDLAISEGAMASNLVLLYRALGGEGRLLNLDTSVVPRLPAETEAPAPVGAAPQPAAVSSGAIILKPMDLAPPVNTRVTHVFE